MKITTTLLLCLFSSLVWAQKTDKKLEERLKKETENFQGDIGIYVQHFKKNTTVNILADTIFPTASIVKVPILVGVFNKINEGSLTLRQPFRYDAKRVYGGSGLMQFYKDSAETELSIMISLMLTYSDNVTSIWNQELAGGGVEINRIMDQLGLVNTKVNSRTTGREQLWRKYGWGQTTPQEIASLMHLIRSGKVFNPQLSDKMYRYLKNQFYNERSLSQIPAEIATASKTGSVDDARGEVVYVHAPSGDYVFSVLTKNNKDQSWTDENEAEKITRKIASIIWNYYEPKHPYTAYPPIK
ncbi:serine hydrolase [Sphingobacterium psychroaquaticum]|uniref:beta-lactamase n=1 Tax=Sphingobacterium psychroaquaticum TaxID=561061 RepID=A0A1X7J294_9SPHI|nr:serine hydrolase [Sphingobacterium psychroaquaticum]SMG20900.1 beta-lactamase class A [Sphingobacterium psychroaquaticum]